MRERVLTHKLVIWNGAFASSELRLWRVLAASRH